MSIQDFTLVNVGGSDTGTSWSTTDWGAAEDDLLVMVFFGSYNGNGLFTLTPGDGWNLLSDQVSHFRAPQTNGGYYGRLVVWYKYATAGDRGVSSGTLDPGGGFGGGFNEYGVKGIIIPKTATGTQRAFVGNTIDYNNGTVDGGSGQPNPISLTSVPTQDALACIISFQLTGGVVGWQRNELRHLGNTLALGSIFSKVVGPGGDTFAYDNATQFTYRTFLFNLALDPPTAVIDTNVTSGFVPLTVNFGSSGSSDADGAIVSRAWNFGDGFTSTSASVTHTYATPGTYTATLTVTDDDGLTSTDTVEITVFDPPVPPIAVANATPTSGQPPLLVAFDGSGSSDDGTIVSYAWDFGDGATGSGVSPSHTYTAQGVFTATLTVTDNTGLTDTDTVQIAALLEAGPVDTIVLPGDCTDCEEVCVTNTWEFSDASWYGCGPPPVVFTSPVCIPGAQLGVGEDTRVLLVTRGAERILAELNPTSGYFERKLNDTSTAKVVGSSTGFLGEACCAEWADVAPWATEIMVFRDGRDVWSGPVTDAKFGYGVVEIEADDLTAWYDRRVVPADLSITDECLGFIFRQLHNAAMTPDPIPNFDVMECTHPIKTSRFYRASDYRYIADEITELGKSGFDWTAYSRVVVTGDGELDLKPYVRFTDDFWSVPPTVRARGNEQATVVIVKGKGMAATAIAEQSYLDFYGHLVRVFDEPDLEDFNSLQRQADSQLALLKDPLYIETPNGATLKPTAPITLAELIPGIRVRVDAQATCRKVSQDFRLVSVKAEFNGNVSVELEPLGAIDPRNNA